MPILCVESTPIQTDGPVQSIVEPGDIRLEGNAGSHRRLTVSVKVAVENTPRECIIYEFGGARTQLQLSHLPPIQLHAVLTPDYPLGMAPTVYLHCSWTMSKTWLSDMEHRVLGREKHLLLRMALES